MGQTCLDPQHYTELVNDSNIDRDLVALNFESLVANAAGDRLFISPQIPRTNSGQVKPAWMRRYKHCMQGGWWCGGLDPLNNWELMDWGTFKPNFPAKNKDNKVIKYEHPPQVPTRIFCLRVTKGVWIQVANLFKVKLPQQIEVTSAGESIGFWQWIVDARIPVIICEGVKKAATLLTYGYPAIALPGINSGYRIVRDFQDNPIGRKLIPELNIFANRKQSISICFDYETVPHKAKLLDTAILHLGELFEQSGSNVRIVRLPGPEKGVDDLIVAQGISAFNTVYQQAAELEIDLARTKRNSELTYQIDLELDHRYLPKIDFPTGGIVGIKSPKGTGKTTALIPLVVAAQADHRPVLLLTHRIQLGQFLCQRIGVKWIDEQLPKQSIHTLGLCLDSIWKLNPADWEGGVIILDEVEQSLWHLLHSSTCKKKRLAILKIFQNLITRVIETDGLIIAQDADLSDLSIDYLTTLANNGTEPWIALNRWQGVQGWDVSFYDSPNPTALIHQLELDLRAGYKCYVTTDSRSGRYGSDTIDRYIHQNLQQLEDCYAKTLVVSSHTTNTTGHPAVDFVSEINTQATEYDAVFVTPSLGTGVSIDVKHFDRVYGIFQGVISDAEARQALARVRADVPRYIWCAKRGIGRIGSGSNNYRSLATWYQENYKENFALMCPMVKMDVDLPLVFDPIHLRTWSKFAARVNAATMLYRETVKMGLIGEGHQLNIISDEPDREKLRSLRTALMQAVKTDPQKSLEIMREIAAVHKETSKLNQHQDSIGTQTKKIQHQTKIQAAQAIAAAPDLGHRDYQYLSNKRCITDLERAQIEKYNLQERYGVNVTPELKLKDDQGYYGQLLTHFYLINHHQYLPQPIYLAWDRDLDVKQNKVFLPDANHHTLKIQGLLALDLISFLDPDRDFCITDPDLVSLKRISYLCSQHIKRAIGIDLPAYNNGEVSPILVLNRFLQVLGLKIKQIPSKSKKQAKVDRLYQLDRSLLNDGRSEIFHVWQHQQSRELIQAA